MAEKSPLKSMLGSFLTRDALDKVLFGFVIGMRQALPGVSKEKAIAIFFRHWCPLGLEVLNLQSEITRFNRLSSEYSELRTLLKSESDEQGDTPDKPTKPS